MTTDVSTPSAETNKALAQLALPRTLMGGTKAMRLASTTYLPQEQAESADAYSARLKRSTLFNAFKKTVKDMTGKVFRKPIQIGNDVPPQLVSFAENIDNAGRHLDVFARDCFFDAMVPGVGYILAEMPPALKLGTGRNGEVTQADEQQRRPYLCYIRRDDVLGWKSTIVDGKPVLTQFRIMECAKIDDGEFGSKDVPQIRVLYPGKWEIWRQSTEKTNEGKWVKYQDGVTSLTYIPIAPIYINRIGFMEGEPPLEDLADLNVAHWQSQSDQKNILHVARVPILFMAGWGEEDTVEIGASRACRSSDAAAKMGYVEHTGNAIGAGDKDLQNLEFQMQVQGLTLIVPQPGGKTATGELSDNEKENSPLAAMASGMQDALEWSFGFMADYLKIAGSTDKKGGSLTINKDFGVSATAADIQNINDAYSKGVYDRETALRELQRRGFLEEGADVEKIAAAAEGEAASLGENIPPGGGLNLQ
ncbi:DUF4055 domain-containing protein [Bradyrhizobium liaoningense]